VTHDQEEANTISYRIAVLDQGVIQQVGEPIELYDNPANKFVADFLGTPMCSTARSCLPMMAACSSRMGAIQFPYQSEAKGELSLVFRPQSLEICHSAPDSNAIKLEGKVKHWEFLGHLVRYGIDVGGQMLLVDDPHLR
jgi:iron(III) transport system ATP-binding protein